MFRCRPISLLLVGLFLWVTACTSYTQIEIGEVADHAKVRVTLTDGERETIREPWVEANSIRSPYSHTIPLDQVAELEAKKKDLASTLVLVGVAVALVTVITLRVVECNTYYGSAC